jgi:hypothetical protein
MAAIRQALTLVAGLALTKIIVDRTTDEPNTPDILPKIKDTFVPPTREDIIEEKLRGLE